ncbi:enolase [Ophiostoma piceae UAMH 11346]|uniref:phosphopyruvate hydratase n=1 Tax=Ophiostoma piceae (strain UAMH 11346) TaxID=1262450 RepID=S3BZG4_OPHP1|nr:enolase [Ophiostoma piceae UAMH 11346]
MLAPTDTETFEDSMHFGVETYHNVKNAVTKWYGAPATGLGGRGGFVLRITTVDQAFDLLTSVFDQSGRTGRTNLPHHILIVLLEDPFAEDHWANWTVFIDATAVLRNAPELNGYKGDRSEIGYPRPVDFMKLKLLISHHSLLTAHHSQLTTMLPRNTLLVVVAGLVPAVLASSAPLSSAPTSLAPATPTNGTTSEPPGIVITGGTTRTVYGTNPTPTPTVTGSGTASPTASAVIGAAAGVALGGASGLLGAAAALGAGIAML